MDEGTKLLLEDILHQIHENRDSVKEEFAIQATAISGRVDAKMDEKLGDLKQDVGKLLAHNEKQNGWIMDHGDRLEKLDGDDGCVSRLEVEAAASQSHRHYFKKLGQNWKWLAAAVIIGLFALHSLFDAVNVKTIIEWIGKLIF